LYLEFLDKNYRKTFVFINLSKEKKQMIFQEKYQDVNVDYDKVIPIQKSDRSFSNSEEQENEDSNVEEEKQGV